MLWKRLFEICDVIFSKKHELKLITENLKALKFKEVF